MAQQITFIENTKLEQKLTAEKASCNILIQGTNAEVTECTKLLQQLKDSNTELNKELDEVKEEAALLRKYEQVADKRIQKAEYEAKEWKYKHTSMVTEVRTYTWDLYDFLLKEEMKGLEIDMDDVRAIIELLHD